MISAENAAKYMIYVKLEKGYTLPVRYLGKQSTLHPAFNQIIGQTKQSTPKTTRVLMKTPRVSKENPLFSSPKHG